MSAPARLKTAAIAASALFVAVAVGAAGPVAAQEPPPSISGVVTIGGSGGMPLEGVTVTAYADVESGGGNSDVDDCEWNPQACEVAGTATTDASGAWALDGLGAGGFRLALERGGYIHRWVGAGSMTHAPWIVPGAPDATGIPTSMWPDDGSTMTGWAMTYPGYVTWGQVQVDLHRATNPADPVPAYTTFADPDGTWGVTGVADGVYRVHFTDLTDTYPDFWHGHLDGPLGAEEFAVDDDHRWREVLYLAGGTELSAWDVMGEPVLTGLSAEGQTLTVDPGTWLPAPDSHRCIWFRDGGQVDPENETTTYLLEADDVGHDVWAGCFPIKDGFGGIWQYTDPVTVTAEPEPQDGSVSLTVVRADERLFGEQVEQVSYEVYAADDPTAPIRVVDAGEHRTGDPITFEPFTIALPPGEYRIRAVLADGSSAWWIDLLQDEDQELMEMLAHTGPHPLAGFEGATVVTVGSDGATDPSRGVIAVHPPTSSLLGGVFSETDDGQGAAFIPLDVGATMEVFPVGGAVPVATEAAGASGVISVDGLAPGEYQVRLTGERTVTPEEGGASHQETVSQWWPMQPSRTNARTIVVPPEGTHWIGVTANLIEESIGTTEPGDRGVIAGDAAVDSTVQLLKQLDLNGDGSGDPVMRDRLLAYDLHVTDIRWIADGGRIPGATASTLRIPPLAEGSQLHAEFTSYLAFGALREESTTPAVTVAPSPFLPFVAHPVPTIAGDAVPGSTLTATIGTWQPGGNTKTYQWLRDGVPVEGATTRTYKVTGADAGAELRFLVTVSKPGYSTGYEVSEPTAAVPVGTFEQTPAPVIRGPFRFGGPPLTVRTGAWKPAAGAFDVEWLRDGEPVGSGAEYALTPDDVGATFTVRVTGDLIGYESVTVESAATVAILPARIENTVLPSIDGAAQVGSTLSADPGEWGPPGVAFDHQYQWLRGNALIPDATGPEYTPTAADLNKVVKVRVTASAPGYQPLVRTSAPTARVVP
ncbi:carboxypeptidase-like regulatory domain-containing protein [Agromyces sp. LHK192]|uniref:carboxypeptidase-like regulatory domain-containing protein n=1 Tax=Agromyces sp. LHK192 TaxID=2498704 RepID=UPI000FD9B922|nr:carboxypeptidase-like regulatory domain-containing protein [Agromyces sp. LHK192]